MSYFNVLCICFISKDATFFMYIYYFQVWKSIKKNKRMIEYELWKMVSILLLKLLFVGKISLFISPVRSLTSLLSFKRSVTERNCSQTQLCENFFVWESNLDASFNVICIFNQIDSFQIIYSESSRDVCKVIWFFKRLEYYK